ncbi:hypothetical protein CONPUDRAFT_164258 [Coniophora puteana RWD-64-598 SS2]|uniref:BTB domain-containing protein n=1 Tax=Coniophora puteana (strain RWD-64-598) TaxID=741705 RepID=A0A5M3MVV9_CONPW|nr:uncharacterized protein CONPUDRAFT_164258 [Coniophora puteana RWD-64-598 SS2]EIW83289.1 hypothetical protein CONPUDRAFT_164258 [Coniophora puteana RWD-64-598 SS2]
MLTVREEQSDSDVKSFITVGDMKSQPSHNIYFSEASPAYGWRFCVQRIHTPPRRKIRLAQSISTFIYLDTENVARDLVGQEVAIEARKTTWPPSELQAPVVTFTNIVVRKSIVRPIFSYPDELDADTEVVVTIRAAGGATSPVDDAITFTPSVPRSDTERMFNSPRSTLSTSMMTGTFFDVMFLAFTRRRSATSALLRPVPIYATNQVLQDMGVDIASGECSMCSHVSPGASAPSHHDLYDYEEDSDLDEDEPQILEELVPEPSVSQTPLEYNSDSIKENHLSDESHVKSPLYHIAQSPEQKDAQSFPTYLVTAAAYNTWRAFVYYTYTKEISFASLTSSGVQQDVHSPADAPLCSPKSMYRLAIKLNMPALAEEALRNFESKLSAKNVLDESLTKFAATYPQVREVTSTVLLKHRHAPEVLQSLPAKIQKIVRGEMAHAEPVLMALLSVQPSQPTPPA